VLERNGGNRTKTAKDLGVDPRTVFRHLERMEAERRGREAEEGTGGEGNGTEEDAP
jgi:DNA-binding NtrC family response regulator